MDILAALVAAIPSARLMVAPVSQTHSGLPLLPVRPQAKPPPAGKERWQIRSSHPRRRWPRRCRTGPVVVKTSCWLAGRQKMMCVSRYVESRLSRRHIVPPSRRLCVLPQPCGRSNADGFAAVGRALISTLPSVTLRIHGN